MKNSFKILVCVTVLLFFTNYGNATIYTIRTVAHKDLAFPIIKNFGIKGNGTGGSIEVRMYYEPLYFKGGESDRSLIYGGSIHNNESNNYNIFPYIYATSAENAPWYCYSFGLWFCGNNSYEVLSTDYQERMKTYFSYVSGHNLFDTWFSSKFSPKMTVVIELEFKGSCTLNNFEEVKLPGLIRPLKRDDFHSLNVKGINFHIRPTATKAQLDAAEETYDEKAVEDFNITQNLMTDHFERAYKIAIPRDIPSDAPRSSAYGTNIAVYPLKELDDTASYPYYFYVSATQESMAHLSGITPTLIKPLFKAMVDGSEYTYKLYKVPTHNADRVLIKGITKLGPFPTEEHGDINIIAPEVTTLNPKMHDKINLPENEKFLVAWHRGDWRGAPENTLESIQAAKDYDLLELDVAKAGGPLNANNVPDYVLFHDPFMFRESSIGPIDGCVDPYDKLLVNSSLLASAQRQNLKNELMTRFPGYSAAVYENWIKEPGDFTFDQLRAMNVRDRFGCLTEVKIPALTDAIDLANQLELAIMIDKGWDEIDGIYWTAIEHNFENNVYFKGGANRPVSKLRDQYGDELMKQVGYTPFYFDNIAQDPSSLNQNGRIKFLEDFVTQEHTNGWNIPGFELQIKMMESDGSGSGFSPDGTRRLLDFNKEYKKTKWMGITQINPTAVNGFDNKLIYMDADSDPTTANPYSSRFDRRADPIFNLNYLECDYWTTDRPDVIIDFLKTLGKTN